ncbi:hypothetical protein KEM48_005360 [Puccinia striiformis f. sp. tritici PST-130]|nr:hypothetical protein KEM48_005360 [Puccinia striiformis f. sp. tritici PST-130]
MSDSSLSKLVWISIKPLIKVLLPTLVGAAMVKYRKLDQEGLKAAAHIQIYGALPCLMFSNVVPSITAQNSPRILVCVGFGLFYMLMSYILSKALLMVVPVPKNFRSGFVVAAVDLGQGEYNNSPALRVEDPTEIGDLSLYLWMNENRMIDQDFIESEGDTITTPYIPYDPTSNRVEQASIDDHPPHADNEAHPTIRDNSPEHDMIAGDVHSPSNSEVQKPTTPDGKPLLSVILDSTDYLGAAAIPWILVTGASFANMSIPRNSWHRLPLRAILGLTIIKLVCLPIIGIIAVSLIDRYTILFVGHEGKVLKLIVVLLLYGHVYKSNLFELYRCGSIL